MLIVVTLNVSTPSVVMPNVVMLNVVAPFIGLISAVVPCYKTNEYLETQDHLRWKKCKINFERIFFLRNKKRTFPIGGQCYETFLSVIYDFL
jgi:hypothetical protein